MTTPPARRAREMVEGRSDREPADYIAETRRLYAGLGYEPYRWAERTDPPPWTPLAGPLADRRVTLIGSGGVYRHGQIAFHTRDDTSVRLIDSDVDLSELRTAHFAYDQTDARADPNCVFPLGPLRQLCELGVIRGLTEHAIAFMGGIYSVRRMEAETAPLIVDECRREGTELALLVPV